MILEIPVHHHPDGSRTIGHPDQRHGLTLRGNAMAVLNVRPILRHGAAKSCDCLSCQTGRPDHPCLIEDQQ